MQIVPLRELRNPEKIEKMCEKEPVYLTKNGYGEMVVMSFEHFERIFGKIDLSQINKDNQQR